MKIEKLSVVEKKIEKTDKLNKFVELMKKYGHQNGYDMLPQYKWHEVSFYLTDTHAGFAHGISRVLTEELDVKCATVDEKNVTTDDKFISDMLDGLIKNINLLPLMQSITMEELGQYDVSLYKYNDTNEIIEVKISDFTVALKKSKHHNKKYNTHKTKGGAENKRLDEESTEEKNNEADDTEEQDRESQTEEQIEYIEDDADAGNTEDSITHGHKKNIKSDMDISELFPASNIIIARLRPGRYLKIKELDFEIGQSNKDAAKFSLLNNVIYYPTDIEPYSIFTGNGTRSITYDSKEFFISFVTAGNITPKAVMENCCSCIKNNLVLAREKIEKYMKSDATKKFYTDEGIDVTNKDDILYYRLPGQYLTIVNMIAKQCYLLDTNILLCTSGVERFDTQVGLIKLKHADPNKLLIAAIDACLKDTAELLKHFK